ncbi:ATP phosphoribosyltransferase [Clostridium oceanicum]|uniref:ATP phosphoribosyltransferase n=1 Tax=Clostridium oceanicum TaxID=1543 RepID=A0ABN1JWB3_9CLOT
MNCIKVALTKGRLEKNAINIFEKIGVNCDELINKGRKLILKSSNSNIEFILIKAVDVLTYVERGVVDIGIVGKDTLMEYNRQLYEVVDLKVGKCKFALASIPNFSIKEGFNRKKIATKYPNVAREYFKGKGQDIEIIKMEGSVELAPLVGLADAIIDIVETGNTLKENGLIVFEDICSISARMIVNKNSIKIKKKEITEIIEKVEGCVENF